MECKIGEIFEFGGEWYQCVKGLGCNECDLSKLTCYHRFKSGSCSPNMRKDETQVIFKKLKKVGEPYKFHKRTIQTYKLYTEPFISVDMDFINTYLNGSNTIDIIIKQTKEDMEEKEQLIELLSEKVHNAWMKEKEAQGFSYGKKYDEKKKKHPDMLPYNELKEEVKEYDRTTVRAVLQAQKELSADANKLSFKEFNLESAKSGKPVCTRDGRKARIICFNRKGDMPITALITNKDIEDNDTEEVHFYYKDGRCNQFQKYRYDLMMLPEKRSGWAKIRKDVNLYNTKEEADRKMIGNDEYVTAKVCWEE